ALRALRALGVDPTPEQVEAIFASRGNETLDAYRMFTDTFGGEGEPASAGKAAPAPAPEKSAVPAPGPTGSWLGGMSVAWADEGDGDEAAIRALLLRYGAALSARNVDQIAALEPGLTDVDRQKLARYFEFAPDLVVQISNVDVTREGDEALV